MTWLERRKYGGKMPSAFVGMVLGMYVMVSAVLFLLPVGGSARAENSLCQGDFPCFSPAACQKAGGAFASCPDKCDGNSNRGFCYAQQEPVPLTIRIGNIREVVDLGAYIQAVYTYAIGVAAVLAAVMMMIGGIQWLTAAGDSGRVSSAKGRITNAVIGLLLTIFAWVFLNTINPSLVRLQMPRIPMVRPQSFVQCDEFKMQKACGQPFGLIENEGVAEGAAVTEMYTTTDDVTGADVITECVGASCSLAGSQDGINTCQRITSAATTGTATAGSSGTAGCSGCASGYDCVSCTHHEQSCTGIGSNSACCGRYCGFGGDSVSVLDELGRWFGQTAANLASATGTCHNGMHGTLCSGPSECIGAKCTDLTRWGAAVDWRTWVGGSSPILSLTAGGICMNGTAGAPCNEDGDCNGLACVEGTGKNFCTPKVIGGFCLDNDDCPSGYPCRTEDGYNVCSTTQYSCARGGSGNDEACAMWYGGDSYRCISVQGRYICSDGAPGTQCTTDDYCRMNGRTGFCFQGAIMDLGTDIGVCVEGLDGNGCDDDAGCQSGVCYNNDGVGRVCIGPNEAGGPCIPGDGDGGRGGCEEGLTCNEQSRTCVPD